MSERMINFAPCRKCKVDTEHRHVHDTAHGIKRTHISGSERHECVICGLAVFKTEGVKLGLKYVLD
jgi:hypothetical protein